MYAVIVEAARLGPHNERAKSSTQHGVRWGGLVAAAALALHPLQLEVARTARMYTLGVLLTLLSTWILLRVLRLADSSPSDSKPCPSAAARLWLLWPFYGLTIAALAYTHNYALLTVAAHVGFAGVHLLWRWRCEPDSRTALAGLAFAIGLTLALYSPWIPVLQAQTGEVSQRYWIRPLTVVELGQELDGWAFGDSFTSARAGVLSLVLSAALLGVALVRKTPAWLLFAAMAALPWISALIFFSITGNSVLQARYLVMAQAGFLLLLGSVAGPLFHKPVVMLAVSLYLAAVATNGVASIVHVSGKQSTLEEMTGWIASRHRQQDVVLVDEFGELTRIQYYLSQAGIESLDIRTKLPRFPQPGHTVHVGSLSEENVLYDWQIDHLPTDRIWYVSTSGASPEHFPGWGKGAVHTGLLEGRAILVTELER
jgi:hypothetical protein